MTDQPLPLKPCPFCGEIPLIKVHEHHCIAGMVFRKDKVSFWNNAYCWKLLAEKDETIKILGEALENIHDVSFDGDGIDSAKELGADIAGIAKSALDRVKGK